VRLRNSKSSLRRSPTANCAWSALQVVVAGGCGACGARPADGDDAVSIPWLHAADIALISSESIKKVCVNRTVLLRSIGWLLHGSPRAGDLEQFVLMMTSQ
jgi:hypothetical protein